MRKLGIIGGVAATVLGATVVMAAGPTPPVTTAPAATGAQAAKPAPVVAGTTNAIAGAAKTVAGAATNPWSAAVTPLTLQGNAAFVKHSDGSATLTMKMQGLDPLAGWSVTIVPGGSGSFGSRTVLFHWTSSDIDRLGNGTLSVHLTEAEFHSIARSRTANGFLILVSDGSREAIATFPKA